MLTNVYIQAELMVAPVSIFIIILMKKIQTSLLVIVICVPTSLLYAHAPLDT